MEKTMNRFAAICLCFMIVIQLIPFYPASASSEDYYGEAYLDLQTDEQRVAYQLLEEGIAGLAPIINFQGILEIEYWDLAVVLRAVCVDNPQYFWFLEEGNCNYDAFAAGDFGPVISFEPKYILDGRTISAGSQELADAMYAFHTKVHQIVDGIPINFTTEYEIALYLHDYLAQNVTYTLEGEHPSAYAALIKGQAACYGYSKAYQCLLNAAGIRARTVTGVSPDENGKQIGHAWNQVWLDGDCYYMDVTWDDFEDVVMHGCFAMSLEKISKDHYLDKAFVLPECGHNQINYHSMGQGNGVGRWNEYTTPAAAAACFIPDEIGTYGAVFHCEVQFTSCGFLSWFSRYCLDIFKEMGLSENTEAYYYDLYDVYYLTLVDYTYHTLPTVSTITLSEENVTLPGPGTQFQLQPQIQADTVWTPTLVYQSSDASIAKVDAYGLITAVSEGTAVITASSPDGSVSASCTILVAEAPEHAHTMRVFEKVTPTCTQEGHETYYLCTDCGRRFEDEDGTVWYDQTSDYVIPAAHQKLLYISQMEYHVQRCKCGVELTETKEKHTDTNGDGTCEVCKLPMNTPNLNAPTKPDKTPSPDEKPSYAIYIGIGAAVVVAVVLFVLIRRRRRGY